MKKIFFVLTAIAAMTAFVACDPDVNPDGSKVGYAKSYEQQVWNGEDIHYKYVYTPTWDSMTGRLASIKNEYYEEDYDWDAGVSNGLYLASKSMEEFSWNPNAWSAEIIYTGSSYNRYDKTWTEDDPSVTRVAFDDTWKIGEIKYPWLTLPREYSYENGYLTRIGDSKDGTTYTWEKGDLVKVNETYGITTITYTSEANPLADGIDPILGEFCNDGYVFGYAGKRTAHLPDKYVTVSGSGDWVTSATYKYEYTKDSQGRITKVKIILLDNETGEPKTDTHVRVIVINY